MFETTKLTKTQKGMLDRLGGPLAMDQIAIGGNAKRTALALEGLGLVEIDRRFENLWYVTRAEEAPQQVAADREDAGMEEEVPASWRCAT